MNNLYDDLEEKEIANDSFQRSLGNKFVFTIHENGIIVCEQNGRQNPFMVFDAEELGQLSRLSKLFQNRRENAKLKK